MFNNINNELLRTISTSSSSSTSSMDELIGTSSKAKQRLSSTITSDDLEQLYDSQINQTNDVLITQFAQRVLEFSSQYGSDSSISYTACNITGRPSKFPNYGDFPETFAMRTYGKWWDLAPSRAIDIMPQTLNEHVSQDFIVMQFEDFVYPSQIYIFETYNPGAIVKLWAFTIAEKWMCLWENDCLDAEIASDSRVFAPPLKDIKTPTRIIRIEFSHRHLDYFTEIDAVVLQGNKYEGNLGLLPLLAYNRSHRNKGPIQRKLEKVSFKTCLPTNQNQDEMLKDFLIKDLENFIAEINGANVSGGSGSGAGSSNSKDTSVPERVDNVPCSLKNMPSEILLKICSYLDLVSLSRVSQTCRKLHEVASDPSLYTELNLMPYWDVIDSSVLHTFRTRCRFVRKVDLSWCGLYTNLTSSDFKEFIRMCGKQVSHLALNSAKFITSDSLEMVSMICEDLKELSLRNASIRRITGNPFSRLTNLERLDLFHVDIAEEHILMLLKNNRQLKHINLAFCQANMDETAITISQYNHNIRSIDMWKSRNLSSIGLLALATTCTQLEEVDFGWCLRDEASPSDALKELVQNCPNLKKLFLAAIRGLNDRDLENIAKYCPKLEQIDLLGVMGISTEKCYEILTQCKKLKLMDLSFCVNLDDNEIAVWRDTFDVSIKRSFVRSDIDYPHRGYNVIRNIN